MSPRPLEAKKCRWGQKKETLKYIQKIFTERSKSGTAAVPIAMIKL